MSKLRADEELHLLKVMFKLKLHVDVLELILYNYRRKEPKSKRTLTIAAGILKKRWRLPSMLVIAAFSRSTPSRRKPLQDGPW